MDKSELHQLLGKISKENCRRSFDRFFDYYYPKLVDFANFYIESHESAEEVASDVLLKLFVNRHKLLFIKKLDAYLYKSVKNQSISYLRKAKQNCQLTPIDGEPMVNDIIEPDASPERKYIGDEFYSVVLKIIENMPPRRQMIFRLVKQEGKTYKEVSELLNISPKTVEVHMGLAIAHIRESLEKYDKKNNFNYLRIVNSIVISISAFLDFTA